MYTPRWKKLKNEPSLRANIGKRAVIIKAIRAFFDAHGYLEIETPTLVSKPGTEPFLTPFETEVRDVKGGLHRGCLITSPEYAMKELLTAGFPKIYQLTKCFRNGEDFGGLHNPEFTMLEWYRAGTDYTGIMDELESLVLTAGEAVGRTVAVPFERMKVVEAFRKYADADALELAKDEAEYHHVFLNAVEPHLGKEAPTILYDYPAEMAALSKLKTSDRRFAERFELYVGGIEIANAFTELTDAEEQRGRFEEENTLREKLGKDTQGLDEDFLSALEEGMPESGGIALGVDRLVMSLLGESDIRRVIAFPADCMFNPSQT